MDAATRAELERRVASETERSAARARVVLLAAEGLPDRRIAVIAGMHHNRVAVWRRRFEAEGLAGLEDVPRPGRPPVRGEQELLAAAGRPAAAWPTAAAPLGAAKAPGLAVAGRRRPAAPHWRSRRALERSADGSDFVSRLFAEQDAGRTMLLVGLFLAPRGSAIAVLSRPGDGGASSPGGCVVGAGGAPSLGGFVVSAARAWRGAGRLHVLVERPGSSRRNRGAGPAAGDASLRLHVAGSRPAWTVQAELVVVLTGQAGAESQVGGLERLRDHRRRASGEAVLLVPAPSAALRASPARR
jgi:hypothetical protein